MLYISFSDCIRKKDVLQKIRDYTFKEFDISAPIAATKLRDLTT